MGGINERTPRAKTELPAVNVNVAIAEMRAALKERSSKTRSIRPVSCSAFESRCLSPVEPSTAPSYIGGGPLTLVTAPQPGHLGLVDDGCRFGSPGFNRGAKVTFRRGQRPRLAQLPREGLAQPSQRKICAIGVLTSRGRITDASALSRAPSGPERFTFGLRSPHGPVTAVGHHHDVNMGRRTLRGTGAIASLASVLALAGPALASDPTASLPATWSHAQINVIGPHGRPHTEIFDRGRVQSVTSSSLTLKESDGSVVTIQVAPNAVVTVDGQQGSFSQIQAGFWARTLGIDGFAAKRVTAISPKRPKPRP